MALIDFEAFVRVYRNLRGPVNVISLDEFRALEFLDDGLRFRLHNKRRGARKVRRMLRRARV